jgi:protein-tyrosine phosphatase
MYEGKPLLLVIGGSDTGRSPIAAALLRKTLGTEAVVFTAGVLSHAGESAESEAQMALEQFGIDISSHISRPLEDVEHHRAELLLAVDRGTEMVLSTRFPNDPRVACLSVIAETADVLDPHRMPLGVWIAVTHQIQEQIVQALPELRRRLGLTPQEIQPFPTGQIAQLPPLITGAGSMQWDTDEHMQRLMQLINDARAPEPEAVSPQQPTNGQADLQLAAPPIAQDHAPVDQTMPPTTPGIEAETGSESGKDQAESAPNQAPSRREHVARLDRMLEVAGDVPEIVDWQRLRQALISRLRALAQQAAGPTDFVAAAALMIEGKLVQHAELPSSQALYLLRRSTARLNVPLSAGDLAAIGGELAEW